MISFKLNKISYETYNTILDLIGGFNKVSVNGVTMGTMKNVEIKDNEMKNFCNKFTIKHMFPKEGDLIIKNNKMTGKYNLINLSDIKKGVFTFKVRKATEKIKDTLSNSKKEMANTVFNTLKNQGEQGHIKIIKNIETNKDIIIGGFDINKNKVLYLKNISGKNDKPANIEITYEHNHIQIVCENVNANIKINNQSMPRIKPCVNEKEDNNKKVIKEGFSITNNGCTSGKEMIVIALIIFLVYKMLTKRTIIKLFE